MYFEDRLAVEGKHEAFCELVDKFRASRMRRADENELFEALIDLGVSEEEADEFINLEVACE